MNFSQQITTEVTKLYCNTGSSLNPKWEKIQSIGDIVVDVTEPPTYVSIRFKMYSEGYASIYQGIKSAFFKKLLIEVKAEDGFCNEFIDNFFVVEFTENHPTDISECKSFSISLVQGYINK